MMRPSLVAVGLAITGIALVIDGCPDGCDCWQFPSGWYLLCSTNLKAWPAEPDVSPVKRIQITCGGGMVVPHLKKEDFRNYPHLERLIITECGLQDIADDAFEMLQGMTFLSLSNNNLTYIHQHTFSLMPKLTVLQLYNNKIDEIPDNAFIHLKELASLRLSGNRIRTIGKHAFEDLQHLNELNLDGNPDLEYVDEKAFLYSNIELIRISGSNVDERFVNALSPLKKSLHSMIWNRNRRPFNLPIDAFKGFTFATLNLGDNQMSDPSFVENLVANVLYLDGNNFTNMDFANYPLSTTSTLYVRNNSLTKLNLSSLSHVKDLEHFRVDDNMIGELFGKLENKKVIQFTAARNKISSLSKGVFADAPDLKEVKLEMNELTHVEADWFNVNNKLQSLEFWSNKIQTVNPVMEDVLKSNLLSSPAGYILLYDNPLHCNCDLKWLRNLLHTQPLLFQASPFVQSQTNCTTPKNVNFKSLYSIDMTCTAPSITPLRKPMPGETWRCTSSGDPAPSVQWLDSHGKVVASTQPDTVLDSFVGVSLPDYESGNVLTCLASNSQGNTTSHVFLLESPTSGTISISTTATFLTNVFWITITVGNLANLRRG